MIELEQEKFARPVVTEVRYTYIHTYIHTRNLLALL